MSRSFARALALAVALAPALPSAGDFTGPESCRACHPSAYAAWRATPHARAQETLPDGSRDDPRCLACHAPDAADGVAGVSCEACHGAGRLYSPAYVMRDHELARAVGLADPGERACLGCHTESTPSLARFSYARKWPLIVHGSEPAPEAAAPAAPAPSAPPATRPPAPARPATRTTPGPAAPQRPTSPSPSRPATGR